MSTQANAELAWLDPWVDTYLEAIGLTLARTGSPERFLKLIGAQPSPADEPGGVLALADASTLGQALIGTAPLPGGPGWILGAESPSCVCYWKAGLLSTAGGMAVALHYTEDSGGRFNWTSNGTTVAEFSLTDGADAGVDGTDPQRLRQALAAAGLDADGTTTPCAAALALFEAITGTTITQQILEGRFTVGSVSDPYQL
jgi:hypothetical protein